MARLTAAVVSPRAATATVAVLAISMTVSHIAAAATAVTSAVGSFFLTHALGLPRPGRPQPTDCRGRVSVRRESQKASTTCFLR